MDAYRTGDFDGIGYIVVRDESLGDKQVLGGDLDCCRDPVTGEASSWALKVLEKLNTYTEPSISGTGFRFFCLGKLPEGIDSVTGHGPDDLTDEMKAHIIKAKPTIKEKLEKGEPAWNGFELYENGPRHLTVTGRRLREYPVDLQHRVAEVLEIITPFLKESNTNASKPNSVEPRPTGNKLPSLNILDVIDTTGFHKEGDELVGPHPTLGSTTGKNLKVNPGKNIWYYWHAGHEAGGDAWLWLAVECGAIPIEMAGPGVLTNRSILEKTLKYAISKGLITEEQAGLGAKRKPTGPTVINAIKALDNVCDGATSKDCQGFNKFDREEHEDLIEKAISEGTLTPKEEKKAYKILKKYKKQLKGLGVNYDDITHIPRDGDDLNPFDKVDDRIPVWIEEHHFKTVTDTERLYRYDHGVYLDDGEVVLKRIIEAEFGDITTDKWVKDIIGKVKRRTYVDRDVFNNKNILNVKNGLLDLETLQLLPHTSDYLSTAQIDVNYKPEASAPRIKKFLKEVAQSKDIALIEEIIGWLLWPDYNVHKAVMLLGPGRNGKGTLLRLITAFLGKKSVSNVTLQDLVADRFSKADLYGKLANIGGDLPSKDLSDTAAFRNLTGGDDNRAQEKYRPAFSFRNKAKLMFSANVLPRSSDDTYAFYSRWILLEFLNVFDVQKGTGDPGLEAKLTTPEELSGLLNIALEGLARLRKNGWKFSYDKTVEDVEIMYKRNANPVLAFLMDECEVAPRSYIEKTVFNSRFNEYARTHGIRPLSTTKFVELLRDQTEIPVADYRPHLMNGEAAPRCWLGVRFKPYISAFAAFFERVDEASAPSTPSRVKHTPIFGESGIASDEEVNNYIREDRDYRNPGRGGLSDQDKSVAGYESTILLTCQRCGQSTDQLTYMSGGSFCQSCAEDLRADDLKRKDTPEAATEQELDPACDITIQRRGPGRVGDRVVQWTPGELDD